MVEGGNSLPTESGWRLSAHLGKRGTKNAPFPEQGKGCFIAGDAMMFQSLQEKFELLLQRVQRLCHICQT